MAQGQQESMTVDQFNSAIDGIRSLNAYPLIKLPPIWGAQCDGAADYWNLDWLKEVVKQAGNRVQLYEFANEPDNPGYCGWTAAQYTTYWNQTVPALKKYARSLGFEIYVGGPAMVNSYTESLQMTNGFMTGARDAYLANGNDRDYVPDFVSAHMYPNKAENPTITDIVNRISYWGGVMDQLRTDTNQIWSGLNDQNGQPLGPQIKLAVSEYNFTIDNDDVRATDAAFIDQYLRAMLSMLKSHDIWLGNLFTIASHGGTALDMLNADGTPKPLYNTFKDVSVNGQLPPVPPAPATLQNPSLETYPAGSTEPTCWWRGGWGTNTYSWSRVTGAHSGSYAQKVTISSRTNGDRALVSAQNDACAIAAVPGKTYTASVWYKSNKPVYLYFYYQKDGVWQWAGQSPALSASSTKWRKGTWTTPVVPAGATRVGVGVALQAVGNMTVDDLGLTAN